MHATLHLAPVQTVNQVITDQSVKEWCPPGPSLYRISYAFNSSVCSTRLWPTVDTFNIPRLATGRFVQGLQDLLFHLIYEVFIYNHLHQLSSVFSMLELSGLWAMPPILWLS